MRKGVGCITVDIEKLIELMIQTNSTAMSEHLHAMEDQKREMEERENDLDNAARSGIYKKTTYTKAFNKAKKRLFKGKLE